MCVFAGTTHSTLQFLALLIEKGTQQVSRISMTAALDCVRLLNGLTECILSQRSNAYIHQDKKTRRQEDKKTKGQETQENKYCNSTKKVVIVFRQKKQEPPKTKSSF
jgi:hypothetical protein